MTVSVTDNPVQTLPAAPALGALYAKALSPAALLGARRADVVGDLPARILRLDDVAVDDADLAAYDRVCGWALRDVVPPTYPHVLGFPLQIAVMTGPGFPLALPGLVHVRNVIVQRRPVRRDDVLRVDVRADRLAATERGTEVDLVTEVAADGEPVWTGRSTYLARAGSSPSSAPAATDHEPPADAVTGTLRVRGDVGRRYAAVSGDVNPLHLSAVTARLFGFRRPIAHGMWSAARLLATLDGRLPTAFAADVTFPKPLLVPATVVRTTAARDDGWDLALRSRSGRPHVLASIRATA